MRSLEKALKATSNEEAMIACLTGIAACEEEDRVLPLIFDLLIDERAQKYRNIRKMKFDEEQKPFPPIPFDFSSNSNPKNLTQKEKLRSLQEEMENNEIVSSIPVKRNRLTQQSDKFKAKGLEPVTTPGFQTALAASGKTREKSDERLKGIDPKIIEMIQSEILMVNTGVTWDDIAGLEDAKQAVKEAIMLPMVHPELFTGLREPPRGVLFFGPPGTGKTMIAKALATFASESGCTFFNISASSILSKWVGEGEKLVRALFCLARVKSPSIIFIDEIDSLLTKRGDTDHESSRRVKTEFLLQFEGVSSGTERILILGSTNRPQDLDEAAKRRFTRRIYIPLPDPETRRSLVEIMLKKAANDVTEDEMAKTVEMTDGYSCADITTLLRESAMVPLRECKFNAGEKVVVRPLSFSDIQKAAKLIRPSVSPSSITEYVEWNNQFGYSAGV